MANSTDIAQVLSMLAAAFPNFKMEPNTPDVYLQLLGDLPADLLKAAVLECCGQVRAFAPSVGEIRGGARDILRAAAGTPTAYEAWQQVLAQIGAVGSWGSPAFTCPLIGQAVDTLGWRMLCMSENTVADRARFVDAYEQLQKRAETDAMRLPVVQKYIEAHRSPELPSSVPQAIKQLIGRMK